MMPNDSVTQFYSGSKGESYQRKVNQVSSRAFSIVARERARKLQPFITASDRVLEYGTGTGWNLAELVCQERLGYDVDNFLVPEAVEKNVRFVSSIEEVVPHSIDVLICHHVLEHLTNPFETLQNMRMLLKPSGKLLLYVPWDRGIRFNSHNSPDDNRHLYAWNCQSLGNLVSSSGYTVKTCRPQKFGYEKISGQIAARFESHGYFFRIIKQLFHLIRTDEEIFVLATACQAQE
ncbi:MAG TPA: class I SAM-dependent methyltransferase [Candidatus Rifleibacterium sp.]|nr:class I SAM-dependent methyltransferase [Candidatus Rifleibacterium sp.]